MSKNRLRSVALLVGYDAKGGIVYDETLSLDEYWDEAHVWDRWDAIKELGMVRLTGRLYASDGHLLQTFENAYSPETGAYIGGKIWHDDGQVFTDGVFANG
jgi:hypothetical protein